MIGMSWRGTHAAELSICRDLEPPSTMRDARSGATFPDLIRATRANQAGDQCASGLLLWLEAPSCYYGRARI